MTDTAKITITCNPPKGFRGKTEFIFGINDEKVGGGYSGDTVTIELPKGQYEILVLVRDEALNSLTGTTPIDACCDLSFKVKYHRFVKKAALELIK